MSARRRRMKEEEEGSEDCESVEETIAKTEETKNNEVRRGGGGGGQGDKISVATSAATDEDDEDPPVDELIEIPDGDGIPLGDIPRIDENIQRAEREHLVALYKVLFNRADKNSISKRNIRKFNGFDFHEKSFQYFTKRGILLGLKLRVLRNLCAFLDLKIAKEREDLAQNILNFLMNPRASGRTRKSGLKGNRGKRKIQDIESETTDEEEDSDDEEDNRNSGSRENEIHFDGQDSEDGDTNREIFQEQEEGKGKATMKCSSNKMSLNKKDKKQVYVKQRKSGKKRVSTTDDCLGETKVDAERRAAKLERKERNDEDGDKDRNKKKKGIGRNNLMESSNNSRRKRQTTPDGEPPRKKMKKLPSDTEIRKFLKSFLEGANLDRTPMKAILQKLNEQYPGIDLSEKKEFVKESVITLVSSIVKKNAHLNEQTLCDIDSDI